LYSDVRFSVHFSGNPAPKQFGMAFAVRDLTMIWRGGEDEKIFSDLFDGIFGLCFLCDGNLS